MDGHRHGQGVYDYKHSNTKVLLKGTVSPVERCDLVGVKLEKFTNYYPGVSHLRC